MYCCPPHYTGHSFNPGSYLLELSDSLRLCRILLFSFVCPSKNPSTGFWSLVTQGTGPLTWPQKAQDTGLLLVATITLRILGDTEPPVSLFFSHPFAGDPHTFHYGQFQHSHLTAQGLPLFCLLKNLKTFYLGRGEILKTH